MKIHLNRSVLGATVSFPHGHHSHGIESAPSTELLALGVKKRTDTHALKKGVHAGLNIHSFLLNFLGKKS